VKGHFHFLEAVRKLLDQPPLQPNLRFLLIGDGELRPRIEAEIERLGLTAHVTLTGFVQDVAPVYADLDLLVLPSLNEGLPVAIVEALSAGVPVVATRVGGVPELLEGIDSAVLVPAKDPAALAGAMAGVLARLDSFSANAQAHRHAAVESYSVDRLVRDLDALYRSLVPGDSP
jgi:glycosyltransferase involved in cell wall biosynthesis